MRFLWLLILGVLCSGCPEEVDAPKIDHFCIVDASIDGCACSRGGDDKFNIPLSECDAYEALPSEDAKKVKIYIIDLKKKILELQKPK